MEVIWKFRIFVHSQKHYLGDNFMGSSLTEWKKKFWQERETKTSVSDHWLRDSLFNQSFSRLDYRDDEWDYESNRPIRTSKYDTFALAKYQKAISNFVYILTRKDRIKVSFNQDGKNYTNGKDIVLSPDIGTNKFDVAVGLALHEASHILYTKFKSFETWLGEMTLTIRSAYPDFYNTQNARLLIRSVFNIIEDRYIDARTFKEAPGYRGYYSALYIEYFGSDLISRALYDPHYQEVTVNNYLFHLGNMANPDRNPAALPSLDKMYMLINLPNILRLKTTKDRLAIAQLVIDMIINEVLRHTPQGTPNSSSKKDVIDAILDKGEPLSQEDLDNLMEQLDQLFDETIANNSSDDEQDDDEDEEQNGSGGSAGEEEDDSDGEDEGEGDGEDEGEEEEVKPLSDKQRTQVDKIIQKQQDLINNTMEKKSLSADDVQMINDIVRAGVEIVDVSDKANNIANTKVYVVHNVTPQTVTSELGGSIGLVHSALHSDLVARGIRAGKALANKLQLRAEERVLTSTRLKAGKIDKRLLAEIGYGNYEIFHRMDIESYNESYIHVSIDASTSMSTSRRWANALEMATILATASTQIPNVRVVVSTRSTLSKGKFAARGTPYIATVFDSKIHGVNHIRQVFPHLTITGGTPEGLCFAAILDNIIKNASNTDAYFINVCDGEPTYSNGVNHTRDQRKILESHGIKILGYFVGSETGYYHNTAKDFKTMYGEKNTVVINSIDIVKIAKTMNQKLLEK